MTWDKESDDDGRKLVRKVSAELDTVERILELRAVIARLRDGRDLLEEKNTLQERRLDDLRDLSGRLRRGGGDDFHDGLAEAGKQMRICMSLSPQPPAPEAGDRIAGLERENAHVSEQLGLATAGEDIATDLLQQIYDYQAGYILEVCLPARLSERIGEFLMAPQPPAPEASEAGELLRSCPRRDELCGECNMPADRDCEWKTPDECSRCAHYDSEELCGLCRRRNPAANDDQWCEKGSTP